LGIVDNSNREKEKMTIAYVFRATKLDSAEYFLNRFLKDHCKRAAGSLPYVASLQPAAQRIAAEAMMSVETVIESQELRGKLLKSMYSGLYQATQKQRPVVSLRNNLSKGARARFLDKLPMDYERIAVSIVEEGEEAPGDKDLSVNEGFDRIWILRKEHLEDEIYKFTFLKGSFEE
jgi:hypothetical protein